MDRVYVILINALQKNFFQTIDMSASFNSYRHQVLKKTSNYTLPATILICSLAICYCSGPSKVH